MQVLRQSTASQTVIVGPFLDEDDAITPLTGLTIANTDIKLMANGGSSANKNSGGATHRVNGEYAITLDATDTATVGELTISVAMAGALVVRKTFRVVEEAVFDALFASSAAGYLATLGTNAPANWINAAAIASSALNGKGDWNIGKTGYALASNGLDAITAWAVAITGNITGNLSGSVGSVTAAVETDSASRTASQADVSGLAEKTDLPTNFAAMGIDASGNVSRVTLVDTTTTNTDMRGTDSAYTGTPPTQAEIYTYFADGTRPNIFKADVSGLVETGDLPANFAALGISGSGHVSRVTLVDTTTTNTDMRGTDSANTATPPTPAEVYDYFGDGTRPDIFKATGYATPSNVTDARDAVISQGNLAWATATGFATPADLAALADYGDANWTTATGFIDTTEFEARTLPTADYATLSGQAAIADAIDELPEPPDEETIAAACAVFDMSSVQDSAPLYSEATVTMQQLNSEVSGDNLLIKKSTGATMHTRALTSQSDAEPVTGIGDVA